MELQIRPVTPDLWPALEDLFGRPGASNCSWCIYRRIGARYWERPRDENRASLPATPQPSFASASRRWRVAAPGGRPRASSYASIPDSRPYGSCHEGNQRCLTKPA